MNNCVECKFGRIENIWENPICRLKNHEPQHIDIFNAIGKVRLESGELVACEDGVKK